MVAARYRPAAVQALIDAKSDLTASDTGVSLVMCCVYASSLECSVGIHSMRYILGCHMLPYGDVDAISYDIVFEGL